MDLLFQREKEVLARFQGLIDTGGVDTEKDLASLRELHSEYALLLDQMARIIKMSDWTGAALNDARRCSHEQSNLDFLTGIANRRHFSEVLEKEWRSAMREKVPMSLLMLDVDHFKAYNDTFGHVAGDRCLNQLAQKMEAIAKRPRDMVARYGGEEFVILLPATDLAPARELAERLRLSIQQFEEPHPVSAGGFVTVSIGVAAMVPAPDRSAQDLLAEADTALYQAKSSGRNCVFP